MIYIAFFLLLAFIIMFLINPKAHRKHLYFTITFIGITSFGIYTFLGSPTLPDWPYHQSEEEKELNNLIQKLEEHLKANPNDYQSWRIMGDAYKNINYLPQAMTAYDVCLSTYKEDANFLVNYAECLIQSQNGEVTQDALNKIETALIINPNHPLGLYFKATYLDQIGNTQESLKIQEQLKTLLK
jgi:cytochrome c-type biogenesis protein CcmH